MEKTVEIELPLVLPGIENEKDECLIRLENTLQGQKGILRSHFKNDKEPVELCLHYDPNQISLSEVKNIAIVSGSKIVNRYHHDALQIEGMDCSDCVVVLEHGLNRLAGVLSVKVNYAAEKMWVEYDSQKVGRAEIEKRIRSMGYSVQLNERQARLQENRELLFSVLSGLLVLLGWLGGKWLGFTESVSVAFFVSAYVFGGWDVAQHAWHAIREKHFDTDLLMIIAALGAASLGQFAEGALLLFLFSLGHALEERALERAQKAVESLADLAPKTALVRRNGKEEEIPVESLQLDEIVIVRPAVRIPVDGVVLEGFSSVDQAPVTGESVPVDKEPGLQVFAGTINGEGALEVKVSRLAKDSTLARIMKMVEEAQAQKSPTQQTVEKFERVFVPVVLLSTLAIIVLPPIFGFPFKESFLRAMTLLVAASPCALALGTPAAILSGIAQAARNGVLVKGGAHLENLGLLKAVAFDKTGTITQGKPQVTDVLPFEFDAKKLLSIAAGAELRSAHPLAKAIVQKAQSEGVAAASVEKMESVTGQGIQAEFEGARVLIGNQNLMDSAKLHLTPAQIASARAFQQGGKTIMWVAVDQQVAGMIALADTLRPEAAAAMRALTKIGVTNTIMLTGDNANSAAAIAKEVGISDFRADLMPEDKLDVIRDLVKKYQEVAMIGDGVNDAPALANATVGIAMGGAGTDVALETADVVLMGDDLSRLPFAVGLGRATRSIIVQNLIISMGVIALLIVASLTGFMSIGPAVVFHEGSTIVVVLNALRLLKFKQG
ncbi:MAG: heavy metal translocating P-type ATPase [Anaerolineaceae bacterium]|nr:heavy metal translocating P-type ATPase [Anaerolineaceae bacterium]